MLYDPCLDERSVQRLREFAEGLSNSTDPRVRRKMYEPGLTGPKYVFAPYKGLARAFAVLVWQAGLMSDCAETDSDFDRVRVRVEDFIAANHGDSPEVNLTMPGKYTLGMIKGVSEVRTGQASSRVTPRMWACISGLGAVMTVAALAYAAERGKHDPAKEALLEDA